MPIPPPGAAGRPGQAPPVPPGVPGKASTDPSAWSDRPAPPAWPGRSGGDAPGTPAAGNGALPAGTPPPGSPPAGVPVGGAVPGGVPPTGRRGRGRLLGVLASVLVLALAVAGVAVVRPGPVDGWLGGNASPTPGAVDPSEPPPPPVLAAAGANAPAPTPEGVRAALGPLVTSSTLGNEVNISVVDAVTGQALYENGQDTPTVPASTTKLVTAAAVLAARGPAYRIATRVVAGANPGEVVIIGAGDPTLAVNGTGWYPGAGRLDRLAAQVKKALGGTAPTKVIVDNTLFPGPVLEPAWDPDIPTGGFGAVITALMTDGARKDPEDKGRGQERYAKPDEAAGRAFAKLLGLPNSAVVIGKAPAAAATAPAAAASASPGTQSAGTELGRVSSPPMIRLVEFMLRDSDNVVAEALARQVALSRDKPASFVGAAEAVDEMVGELGLPAAESSLADGSGLSRANRVTPSLLTDVLTMAAKRTRPELADLFPGLPVAAWSGTLRDRFDRSGEKATKAGAGVVRAKTGTLSGVHAISGVVTTADGRLLAFAVLANRVPVGQDEAQRELDRIATTLARCGCR
ncbi:D-alanyl-D-alanine carboxypeptidase/D-alanyl-D-alanine-endopeptidase [Plantactinospora sp. BC1]|nr:D-alanyl-D-alanine carboxypeptidase/D-alanyl-D-alanine-endopeptidase [Plantactinospora sp. BC1]